MGTDMGTDMGFWPVIFINSSLVNLLSGQNQGIKERALMVLMELQNRGVSLDEIYGLSKILDPDKLGKEWHYGLATGVAQQRQQYMIGSCNGLKDFKLDNKLNCA